MLKTYLKWDDARYSVGVEMIDAQHKKLFNDINALIKMLDSRLGLGDLEVIVDDMIDYFDYHFSTEEKLLKGHPDFASHKAKHRAFVERITDFDKQLLSTTPEETATSLYLFLGEWFQNHIQKEDRAYFAYLRNNNLNGKP